MKETMIAKWWHVQQTEFIDHFIFDENKLKLAITCQTEILVNFEWIENELKFEFLEYVITWKISFKCLLY